MAQVKLLKITSGVFSQLNEVVDSARVHSLGLGVDANFTDGYSLSIQNSTGTAATLAAGVVIYSNSGNFKVKQSDGTIVGGFSVGGDLTGSATSQTVSALQGTSLTITSPTDGYVLTYDASSTSLKLKPSVGGFVAAGDLSGTSTSQTVSKINGTSVPAAPTANQVLVAASGSTSVWSTIYDGYVSSSAAIAGTKISPNFGSQNITTTGSSSATSFDRSSSGALNIGATNATSVTIGGSAIPTVIAGNLTVNGTTTTINSTVVDVADRIIHVNHSTGIVAAPTAITGISIHRGSTNGTTDRDHAGLFWDESNSIFKLAYNTAGDDSTLGANLALQTKYISINPNSDPIATDGYIRLPFGSYISSRSLNNANNLKIFSIDNVPTIDTGNSDTLNIGSDNAYTSNQSFDEVNVSSNHSITVLAGDTNSLTGLFVDSFGGFVALGNNNLTANNFVIIGDVAKAFHPGTDSDGYGIMYLGNAQTVPTINPILGVNLYSQSGSFKIRDVSGNILGGFLAGGDLSGTSLSQTVTKLQGNPIKQETYGSAQDGYVLTWVNADGYIEAKPMSTGTATGAAGGDLSGTYPNPTVSKINATTISTAGGSLTAGKVLRVTGASTADYGAVDLANSNAVTGTLPTSNQAAQTMTGDVSGTTGSNIVNKIKGNPVQTATYGAAQDGYVLTWVNADGYIEAKPSNAISITQSSHGFTTGQAVYYTGSAWAAANASSISTLGIGIVVYVDANNFNLYQTGKISGLSGLTAGQYYFVSDVTSGLLTATEPNAITSFSNPLLFALSSSTGLVLPFRPSGTNTSSFVSEYDFLLANDPVTTVSYATTFSGGLVTNESWSSGANLVKNIAYTYSSGLCSQEVRKVYATDGTTIVAQLTIAYTYVAGVLSSAAYTRDV